MHFFLVFCRSGNFDIKNEVDEILQKIEEDRIVELNVIQPTHLNHLQKALHKTISVLDKLTVKQLTDRISNCDEVLK